MNADCTNCKWNHRDQVTDEQEKPVVGQHQYTCHRFPPSCFTVPGPGGTYRLASAFPVVTTGMVCSLHEFPDHDGAVMSGNVPDMFGEK